jgi:DNA polymerase III epsilon subunit-like protein
MIYINVDLETTGLLPDKHAILSIGAVAHEDRDWQEIGKFSWNVKVPADRTWDPVTEKWWESEPEAFAAAQVNAWNPPTVCNALLDWLEYLRQVPSEHDDFDDRLCFVANPIAYDLPFLRSYMKQYLGEEWERFAENSGVKLWLGGVDLPTLAMAVLGVPYLDARRSGWPKEWRSLELPHTHVAIDDARHQAHAFICMMKALRARE